MKEIDGNFTLPSVGLAIRFFEVDLREAKGRLRSKRFEAVVPMVRSGNAQEYWYEIQEERVTPVIQPPKRRRSTNVG